MKRAWLGLSLLAATLFSGLADAQQTTFPAFIENAPGLTVPPPGGLVPMVSGGVTYGVPYSSFINNAPSGSCAALLGVITGTCADTLFGTTVVPPTIGGTGANNGSNTITVGGNLATGGALTIGNMTATGNFLQVTSSGNVGQVAPGALTGVNDTNVTLSLGGAPSIALLNSASLTLGWTGTLSPARGGLGANNSAATGIPQFASGTPSVSTALANNTTATTQTAGDSSTNVATDAFVSNAVVAGTGNLSTLSNCSISEAHSSNNVTYTLNDASGNTLSSSDACVVGFRSLTATNGALTIVSITSSRSITLDSGSTLGTTSGVPFRVWASLVWNTGAAWLTVSVQSTSTQIFPLSESVLQSPTSCVSCNSATSAGTLYNPCTVNCAGNAIRIIGFMNYNAGLTTAGQWSASPTEIQMMGQGIAKPGETVQRGYATNSSSTNASSTTPAQTSLFVPITPTSTINLVRVAAAGPLGNGAGSQVAYAQISRGTSPTLIGNKGICSSANVVTCTPPMIAYDAPGTTSSTTYYVYVISGGSYGTTFGSSTIPSAIEIQEIMGALEPALEPANDNFERLKIAG